MELDSLLNVDAYPRSDFLLSEDIWSKFQWDTDMNNASSFFHSVIDGWSSEFFGPPKCLIHHDCMWTGLCGSKEHNGADDSKSSWNTTTTTNNLMGATPGDVKPPPALINNPQRQVPASPQQSLLKNTVKMAVNPSSIVPMMPVRTTSCNNITTPITPANTNVLQTPPMSDDEESKPTEIQKHLHDVFKSLIDDDSDMMIDEYLKDDEEDFALLDEELEEEEEPEEEEEEDEDDDDDEEEDEDENEMAEMKEEMKMRAYYAAESDHSYHKANTSLFSNSLGIDTPSDSEEEIDVVSLGGDKYNINMSSKTALPNNPSTRDRHQLQKTMQSRFPQGIKTLMPIRRPAVPAQPQIPAAPSNRSRMYRQPNKHHHKRAPLKQRHHQSHAHHSSDSEQEPCEKRHLHNNMERQRRIDLRNLFDDLKVLVPDVNKKPRAAKVMILRAGAQYCKSLTNTSNSLNRQVDDLKRQQERLRARVSMLRRNLAAHR